LPKIFDPRGNLTVAEGLKNIPFPIARAYWVYDVPGGESRGGHAHKSCLEFIVAVSGCFNVSLDNGSEKETFFLNHPWQGLLVETNVWRTLDDFSSGAVCMVLASEPFSEEDYIREYEEFLKVRSVERGVWNEKDAMFTIERYTDSQQTEWNSFVAQSRQGSFLFDRRYMDYHADRYADCSLMFFRKERLYAMLPANVMGDTLYSHQGLTYGGLITGTEATTADTVTLFEEMKAWLGNHGINNVVYKAVPWIYHCIPAEEDLYALFHSCDAKLIERNISSTIVGGRHLKWHRDRRYNANKASRNGFTIELSDDFEGFWRVLDSNLYNKYGVHPVHSLDEIRLLKSRFPHNIILYTAVKDGEVLGGTVLYLTPQVAHAQYISATLEGKKLGAIDAIYDRILNYDLADYPYFDFGKSTEDGGHYLNETLIHQKEGFGGRGVCYDTYEWTV